MPDSVSIEKQKAMENYGARVILCDSSLGVQDEGHYTCKARSLTKEIEDSVYMNQFLNAANFLAHYENGTGKILEHSCRLLST